jgi:hypothetical protein
MDGFAANAPSEGMVEIVLVGGPADIPAEARRCRAISAEERIKLAHRGGYEHFEPTSVQADEGGSSARVFRWTMRTKIAE